MEQLLNFRKQSNEYEHFGNYLPISLIVYLWMKRASQAKILFGFWKLLHQTISRCWGRWGTRKLLHVLIHETLVACSRLMICVWMPFLLCFLCARSSLFQSFPDKTNFIARTLQQYLLTKYEMSCWRKETICYIFVLIIKNLHFSLTINN